MKKIPSDEKLMRILEIDEKTLMRFKAIQKGTIAESKKLLAKKSGKINVIGISGSMRDEFDYAQEDSSSEWLLKKALDECSGLGAKTELIPLRKFLIKPCKACYSTVNTQCHWGCTCYKKGTPEGDDMSNRLYSKIYNADAVIFATPVNNFGVSTMMKAFIDRCISMDGSLAPANPKSPKDRALNLKHMKFIGLTADNEVIGSGFLRRFAGKVAGMIATGHEEGASLALSQMYMTLTHYGMIFPPFGNMYAMSSVCYPTYVDTKVQRIKCYEDEARLLAQNVVAMAKKVADNKAVWSYDKALN